MKNAENNYTDVLLEEMRNQIQVILEIVSGMREEMKQLPQRDEFEELKADVRIIKAVVTDNCKQLKNHEKRITKLETAR